MTDVTGFGLAGHLLGICRGSKLRAHVRFDDVPVLHEALEWARQGTATGASGRNWSGYGHEVALPGDFADWKRNLITDPQTSGGLLVACDAGSVGAVMDIFRGDGFACAAVVGHMEDGAPGLSVT
jgi:selenide,water dikinase